MVNSPWPLIRNRYRILEGCCHGLVRIGTDANPARNQLCNAFENHGLPRPEVSLIGDGIRVTVFNVVENGKLKQEKIIRLIRKNKKISAAEISQHIGISERTTQRYLKLLQADRTIKRVGSDKGGHWEILKKTI